MASPANSEIVPAKSALAVVTCQATLPTTRRVMIERLWLCDLAALRHAGPDLMTRVARSFGMLRVTETDAKCLRKRRRPRIAPQLMTNAARRDITPARLRFAGVTPVASRMRAEACRNRKRDATSCRAMAGRASSTAHVQVARVFELHIETSQARKSFQRS